MKKLTAFLVCLLLLLSAGCGEGSANSEDSAAQTQSTSVTTTTTTSTQTEAQTTTTAATTVTTTAAPTTTAKPQPALCGVCGKAGVVKGSAYCATCKCTVCNDRKRTPQDAGCEKHNCALAACPQKAQVTGGYCQAHGCAHKGCTQQKTVDFGYCTDHNVLDILIFSGQSNMAGSTEGVPYPNDPVPGAVEFRSLTGSFQPLVHPVGEVLGGDLLTGGNNGSPVPYTCAAYTAASGRQAVAIHVAQGATRIDQWLKGTDRYTIAVDKIQAGIRKAEEVGKIGRIVMVWLQGESDALNRTSKEDYMRMMTQFKNDLKQDVGLDTFGIIEVGYFCYTVGWLNDRSKEDAKACDETIMQAQEELPRVDKDFVMLTQITKVLSLDSAYENPLADGHYTNKGVAIIGEEAGKALAKLVKE